MAVALFAGIVALIDLLICGGAIWYKLKAQS